MYVKLVDRVLCSLVHKFPSVFAEVSELESKLFKNKITDVEVKSPIYITGLARSGTTMILEKLVENSDLGTHQYGDFPFIMNPILWNIMRKFSDKKEGKYERPHRDGVYIQNSSPEAFEEPLWQYFFPDVHNFMNSQLIDASYDDRGFSGFYRDHIKKILYLRTKKRYLSKGNYNFTRIPYLLKHFPDAKFIIPVRHPFSHVESLCDQHNLFCRYAKEQEYVARYLEYTGHYEFGPQRVPIVLDDVSLGQKIVQCWSENDSEMGYAMQWSAVYNYIFDLSKNPRYSKSILIVPYEQLCEHPQVWFERIANFSKLQFNDNNKLCENIHPPKALKKKEERLVDVVAETAHLYGYFI